MLSMPGRRRLGRKGLPFVPLAPKMERDRKPVRPSANVLSAQPMMNSSERSYGYSILSA